MSFEIVQNIPNKKLITKDIDIFYCPDFFKLHSKTESLDQYTYAIVPNMNPEKLGFIFHCGEVSSNVFRSPKRGSYGGFYWHPSLDYSIFEDLIAQAVKGIENKGGSSLEIVLPPVAYNEKSIIMQFNILRRLGFNLIRDELNYSIKVDDPDFQKKIDHGNRKRIAKAQRENLEFKKLTVSDYQKGYDIISENRKSKGYELSMTWQQIEVMLNQFPDQSFVHGVYQKDVLIAASISFNINSKVRYVFYWGDKVEQGHLSPVTFLANGLYSECLDQGIELLDLGTSSLNGQPNLGLIRYKENLGATVSAKYFLKKEFHERS